MVHSLGREARRGKPVSENRPKIEIERCTDQIRVADALDKMKMQVILEGEHVWGPKGERVKITKNTGARDERGE